MDIVKFKKDRGNYYKVFFNDDTSILLHDDVIVKYNLLVNKNMNKKKYEEVLEYNDFLKGYYKSIKYINTKLRSEVEIKEYLKKMDINTKETDKIIKLLYKDGYLNKDNYLRAFINDKYNLSNIGPIKIKSDLIKIGYSEFEIDKQLLSKDWNMKLNNIISKKIKNNHNMSNNMLKIKTINDIIRIGYEKEKVVSMLNSHDLKDDYSILEKELVKIKNKYSNKYSEKELEFKVVNYLYKKGFDLESIKRCYNEKQI